MIWAVKEFKSMNLGDPRRKQRAIHLIESLSAKPTASIPQACGDWADTI
ncbi:IS4 family transposase, partial [Verminephrobacter aporrectodeae subsp. tuberculatae]